MDSDSPVNVRIAGQPTLELGAPFTAGNTHPVFTRTRRTHVGSDSDDRSGHRRSSASRRVPHGHGHHP
ncbi:hypothetical protein DJ70_04585 [Halorubrum halodurans]|uniref:Uncharacterized protein n=1 Tax=Halorubrum halodurans TaxID=1383851 RepID=A0A256IN49_9EURY|nr:hypothetical protein DJ70_04585 [Halorubrum halodurans]